jgi:multicomponent Na+:H+ antiporter subunit E
MAQTLILSVPMALAWVMFTRETRPQGFIIGYVFGFAIVWLIRANSNFERGEKPVKISKIPSQIWATVQYAVLLAYEIFISGIDVAKRVLAPTVDVTPCIYKISTQDPSNSTVISALSAHGITITPGTLVIDYESENGETWMYVHSLDSQQWDEQSQIDGQTKRVKQIKRMLGDE